MAYEKIQARVRKSLGGKYSKVLIHSFNRALIISKIIHKQGFLKVKNFLP